MPPTAVSTASPRRIQQLAALEELHLDQRPSRVRLRRRMILGHPLRLRPTLLAVEAAGVDPDALFVAIGLHPGFTGLDRVAACRTA